MTDVHESAIHAGGVPGGEVHEDELTEADLDALEALGAAEDAELILGNPDA